MKISRQLPQFSKQTALLVVAGQLGAEIYLAKDGEVAKILSFDLPKPRYSDRAGRFIRRGRGRVMSFGAVRDVDKGGLNKEFIRVLTARVKTETDKKKNLSASYVYAPGHLIKQIKKALAPLLGKSYKMSFRGNYLGRHPFILLEMVTARRSRRADKKLVRPTRLEAVKILNNESIPSPRRE